MRSRSFKSFLRDRVSRESVLGLHFTLGILLLSVATWIFARLAEDVAAGDPLTVTDARFSQWLHLNATPWLTRILLIVTHLHSTAGISIMTLLVSVYLWREGLRRRIISFVITVYGGMLMNVWLKGVFQRARPHFDDPLIITTNFSFPSGHTMGAAAFYGALAAAIISRVSDWRARVMVVVAAVLMVTLVGFSRIYLGAHYLSDVLGAMIEGVAWLALCLTAFEAWQRRTWQRRKRSQT
jgi:membrane-associated phospholipid phosphatase